MEFDVDKAMIKYARVMIVSHTLKYLKICLEYKLTFGRCLTGRSFAFNMKLSIVLLTRFV